ncbi:ribonuclease H-like domain-containing protein [Chloroflexi bacterium TSY]|nr:ribonuclease H-like domain-containing protein [Chloroflexi bacterium TSY]
MSSTLDRLRRLHGVRTQTTRTELELPAQRSLLDKRDPHDINIRQNLSGHTIDHPDDDGPVRLEDLVPGEVIENEGGTCYVLTHTLPLETRHGPQSLGTLLSHQPGIFHSLYPDFNLMQDEQFWQAAFIDTETTGLGGGAGIYCFMVGIGTFENIRTQNSTLSSPPTHFVVRQLFMRNMGEEAALLVELAKILTRCTMTVTFNGRTFDLPLLRTRLRQCVRLHLGVEPEAPLLDEGQPHLDLLHPARRLWKRRLQSCRLINLERRVLGLERSEEDVPGHLIPFLYANYARSGDARQMPNIFYHNREDIVSMVSVAERLSHAFGIMHRDVGVDIGSELSGLDWLSLGCCYDASEEWEWAEKALCQALTLIGQEQPGSDAHAEAFRRLGQLQKRQERWQEATETWQLWLSSVTGVDPTPYIELAKYCEWQLKDLEQASMWAGWALHNMTSAPAWQRAASQIAELEHRVARLERKKKG